MKENEQNYQNEVIKQIQIDPDGKTKRFRSFDKLQSYIQEEQSEWMKYGKSKLKPISDYYTKVAQLFNSLGQSNTADQDKIIVQQINSYIKSTSKHVISSKSTFGQLLISQCKVNQHVADGFWMYYFDENGNFQNIYHIKGAITAHEYKYQFKNLEKAKESIVDELNDFYKNYSADIAEMNKNYENLLSEISKKNDTIGKQLEEWHVQTKKEMEEELNEKKNSLEGMEKLYNEKLRLEGPATYWENYRNDYRKSGIIWSIVSGIITAVIVTLSIILIKTMPEQIFTGDKLSVENTIRWTISLALIFSSLFYSLRITIRLVLSAFHLSRDANERLQLTHQYLALLSRM